MGNTEISGLTEPLTSEERESARDYSCKPHQLLHGDLHHQFSALSQCGFLLQLLECLADHRNLVSAWSNCVCSTNSEALKINHAEWFSLPYKVCLVYPEATILVCADRINE